MEAKYNEISLFQHWRKMATCYSIKKKIPPKKEQHLWANIRFLNYDFSAKSFTSNVGVTKPT